ncbi:MAG: hypothetical protein ACYDAD_06045 [Acidimicrobiales bacterium]
MALIPRPPGLDRRAAGAGAVTALLVTVPAVVGFRVVDAVHGVGCRSRVADGFVALLFLGWMAGGFAAGRLQPRTPFTNAAVAALGAFVVVTVLQVALSATAGGTSRLTCGAGPSGRGGLSIAGIVVTNAILAVSAAMLGALLASASSSRRHGREPGR